MKYSLLKSIRIQLLLLVLISLLPALGTIVYSGLYRQYHEIEEAESDALRMLHNLANEHERAVESARQLLMILARLPEVRHRNASACNKLFAELLKVNPTYTTILAADATGMVFANALPFTPHSIKHRKYFQDILQTMDFSAGEYTIGLGSGRATLPFAHPVLDSTGQVQGVVVVGLSLSYYGEIFSAARLPEKSVLTITDRRGIRLYSHLYPEKYVGKPDRADNFSYLTGRQEEGTFRGRGVDGTRRLYAFKRFRLKKREAPYLFMRIGISEEEALSLVRRELSTNIGLLCSALVVAVVLAWFTGNILLVRRLNRLVDASEQLKDGDLSARTRLEHREDELGRVTKAFDEMAAQLEERASRRKLAEEALRLSEEKYRSIVENSAEGIFQTSPEGRFLSVNPAMVCIYGYESPEEMIASIADIGKQLYVDPEGRASYRGLMENYGAVRDFVHRSYRKDGTIIWASVNSRAVKDAGGKLIYYEGTIEDVTRRKEAEEALKQEKETLFAILEADPSGIAVVGKDGVYQYVNPKFTRITGYSLEDFRTGRELFQKIYADPEYRKTVIESWKKTIIEEGKSVDVAFTITCKDGSSKHVEFRSTLLKDFSITVLNDITDRKELAEKLRKMAIIDELTGLYNRRGFFTLAQQQFKLSERDSKGMILFFADLDDLKHVNDALGHQEGDRALIEAAMVLRHTFRDSDIIGRMGGDEFAILVIDATDETKEALVTRLQNILDNHNKTGGAKYSLSLSIGAVRYDPENPVSLDELIAGADTLMYAEKKNKENLATNSIG